MTTLPPEALLPAGSFALALLRNEPHVRGCVEHGVGDDDGLLAAAQRAAVRPLPRDELVAALLRGLDELAAPESARRAAERLRAPGVVAVVTGQQPGLLGGPELVLTKALAALALARRVESLGVPAVPVFWHASEDDDLAEADHVAWLADAALQRVEAPFDAPGGRAPMLARAAWPARADVHLDALLARHPGSAVAEEVRAALQPSDAGGATFGRRIGRLLARVLGAQGIVVVEPHALRALAAPVVAREIDEPGALHALAVAACERVVAAGFPAPLALRRAQLYYLVDEATGARERVRAEGRFVVVERTGERRAAAELRARLDAEPTAFAWNVVSRVLAQDTALPVAAQVCGPAELGYCALLREAHAAFGVAQPALWLRPGASLVPPAVRRACAALGVAPRDVVARGAAAFPAPTIADAAPFDELERAIAALPPGASRAAVRRRAAVARQAALLRAAATRDAAAADELGSRRRALVRAALRPDGLPAERVLAWLPWFLAGGDAFVARLAGVLGTSAGVHHVLAAEDL